MSAKTRRRPDTKQRFSAVVLAGSRRGVTDPVALARGARHKSLVPVAGVPMLRRVVETLGASGAVRSVAVSLDDPTLIEEDPGLAALLAAGKMRLVASAETPSRSVARAVDALGAPWPLLVTTSDHPLLTPEMVDYFCAASSELSADIVGALASAKIIQRDYPEAVRTFLRFRDGRYSGCNLFALMTPASLRTVAFWGELERHRKRPWRLFAAVGPLSALLALAGFLTLDQGLARLSARTGARSAAVRMPFADAAIDVDKPQDLDLAERILLGRG